jgi:hypothetical protein
MARCPVRSSSFSSRPALTRGQATRVDAQVENERREVTDK